MVAVFMYFTLGYNNFDETLCDIQRQNTLNNLDVQPPPPQAVQNRWFTHVADSIKFT